MGYLSSIVADARRTIGARATPGAAGGDAEAAVPSIPARATPPPAGPRIEPKRQQPETTAPPGLPMAQPTPPRGGLALPPRGPRSNAAAEIGPAAPDRAVAEVQAAAPSQPEREPRQRSGAVEPPRQAAVMSADAAAIDDRLPPTGHDAHDKLRVAPAPFSALADDASATPPVPSTVHPAHGSLPAPARRVEPAGALSPTPDEQSVAVPQRSPIPPTAGQTPPTVAPRSADAPARSPVLKRDMVAQEAEARDQHERVPPRPDTPTSLPERSVASVRTSDRTLPPLPTTSPSPSLPETDAVSGMGAEADETRDDAIRAIESAPARFPPPREAPAPVAAAPPNPAPPSVQIGIIEVTIEAPPAASEGGSPAGSRSAAMDLGSRHYLRRL